MKTIINAEGYVALALLVASAVLVFSFSYFGRADAAGGFLPATMASSSAVTVGTSPSTPVFATSSPNCSARIIGTASSSIMVTFTDKNGDVPNIAKGFWQGASTTVAYDSGLFGCGAVKVFSVSSQQIMVAETF